MYLGLLLLTISYLPWLFEFDGIPNSWVLFGIAWGLGFVLICNSIIGKYSKKKPKFILKIPLLHIFIVGVVSAFIIELLGNWIWKFWHYPHFSDLFYVSTIIFQLTFYFYFLFIGYVAARAVLIAYGFSTKPVTPSHKYNKFFNILGVLGIIGLAVGTIQILGSLNYQDISFFNSVGNNVYGALNILLILTSFLFVLEFLQYKRREDTFLLHLIKGDWTPLFAILIASTITGILLEGFNIPVEFWQYTNWPYIDFAVEGLPLLTLIIWPIQYVYMIAIYRLLYKKETAAIWY